MIPANIEISIDKSAIKQYIERQIDQQINDMLFMVDVKRLSELCSMSPRFLEEEILNDPRMRAIERKKSRKRWYFYSEAMEAIREIVNEW